MSIEQILIVMLYTLKPYVGLIVLVLALLIVSWLFGRTRQGKRSSLLLPVSALIGLASALAAPTLTNSKLSYVTTTTDWIALIGIGLGATLYAWLLLAPIWKKP